jgi:hypothetical protein
MAVVMVWDTLTFNVMQYSHWNGPTNGPKDSICYAELQRHAILEFTPS